MKKQIYNKEELKILEDKLLNSHNKLLEEIIELCLIKSIEYFCENHLDQHIKIWSVQAKVGGFMKCAVLEHAKPRTIDSDFMDKCWHFKTHISTHETLEHIRYLFKDRDINLEFKNTPGKQIENIAKLLGDEIKAQA